MIVELKNIWKVYPMGTVNVEALKGINIGFARGDFVAIAGPSGSGKSTLLNTIGLIDQPTKGSVLIEGRDAGSLNRRELPKIRREILGFVFQSFNLLPVLTVFENVELPLIIGKTKVSSAQRKNRVEYLLEQVELADRSRHLPAELSGGQQQRAAIARALVTSPKIVIADEPTANLDSATGERILELMKKINKEEKTTFVFATHDAKIWDIADHILFMRDGTIESEQRK